jgi:hypothetical protein
LDQGARSRCLRPSRSANWAARKIRHGARGYRDTGFNLDSHVVAVAVFISSIVLATARQSSKRIVGPRRFPRSIAVAEF